MRYHRFFAHEDKGGLPAIYVLKVKIGTNSLLLTAYVPSPILKKETASKELAENGIKRIGDMLRREESSATGAGHEYSKCGDSPSESHLTLES